jgi:hypothetical protein
MDAIEFIDAGDAAEQARDAGEDGCSLPGKARRLHAKGSAGHLSVTSDLTSSEPVTDAEIRLILAVLGDTLSQILTPNPALCSAQTPTSAV